MFDCVTDEFRLLVDNYSKTRSHLLIKCRDDLFNSIDKNNSKIYFIDALGVEYLSVFAYVLEKKGLDIKYNIGLCNLPSTTEYNKSFLSYVDENNMAKKVPNFDNRKHKGSTKYYYSSYGDIVTLLEDFDDLYEVSNSIIYDLANGYDKVIIVSDHGASRLCVLDKNSHKYQIKSDDRCETRYCIDIDNSFVNFSRLVYINGKKVAVSCGYDSFQTNGPSPKYETHGGGTIEETFVPIIEVSSASNKIELISYDKAVLADFNNQAKIRFKLSKFIENVHVDVEGVIYDCSFSDEYYVININAPLAKKYVVKIISTAFNDSFEVNVDIGIQEDDFGLDF